jgi:hypothetical protein
LFNPADKSTTSLSSEWPLGYELQAALDLQSGQAFVPTPGLIERLDATPYVSRVNIAEESVLKEIPDRVNLRSRNAKHFIIHVPDDLAGHTLTIVGVYRSAGKEIKSRVLQSILIVEPCDQQDYARIRGSKIFEAREIGNCRQAIELATSLLEDRISDPAGLNNAILCARDLKSYDEAIVFLDQLFNDYGVVSVDLSTARPPRFDPLEPREDWQNELYEVHRNGYLRLKAELEQQQR